MITDSDMLDALTETMDEIATVADDGDTAYDSEGYEIRIIDGEEVRLCDRLPSFRVVDEDGVEWFLRKKMDDQAEIAAIEMKRAAMNAHYDRLKRIPESRIEHRDYRYGGQVEAFVKARLQGCDRRTLDLEYGQVTIRKTRAKHEIVPKGMGDAVAWVKSRAPERVKVRTEETVGIKDVLDELDLDASVTGRAPQRPWWFHVTPEAEKVTPLTSLDLARAKDKKGPAKGGAR